MKIQFLAGHLLLQEAAASTPYSALITGALVVLIIALGLLALGILFAHVDDKEI